MVLIVLFLLLDHLSKDDRLSHLAELVRTVIEWAMKSMTAAAIGFQVIQGLILPAVDGLKNTAVSRLRKKLEVNPSSPKYIQTVKGIGYRFNKEV